MKILILHGWGHSAKEWLQLKSDLERQYNCTVTIHTFPGFGHVYDNQENCGLQTYVQQLRLMFKAVDYDFIIAHSMGANVLLKALANNNYKTVPILINPAYGGIPKLQWIRPFRSLLEGELKACQKHPNSLSKGLIKLLSLFTINHLDKVNEQIIEDILCADPKVATNTLLQLVYDEWGVFPHMYSNLNFHIIYGEYDRLFDKKVIETLSYDLLNDRGTSYFHTMQSSGHTPFIEVYNHFFDTICKIIDDETQ